MPSTKTFNWSFSLPYSAASSHGLFSGGIPSNENPAFTSNLYDMEDRKTRWYLWLFLEKDACESSSYKILLTLNLPFCEYPSNRAKIKCAGQIMLFDGRLNRSFASEKTIAKGESTILFESRTSLSPGIGVHPNASCSIMGNTTVEEENQPVTDVLCKYLSNDLNKVLEEQLYGDIILIVEGRELLAYKGILAARSPVFAAMFETDMKEKKDDHVEIDDIPYEVLKELVRYMYTEQVPNLKEISTRLFVAADKYQLSTLKEICEDAACSTLTVSNVSMNLVYSAMHNGGKLKSAAIEFIRKNKQEVIKSEEWKNIRRDYPVLLVNSVLEDLF